MGQDVVKCDRCGGDMIIGEFDVHCCVDSKGEMFDYCTYCFECHTMDTLETVNFIFD